MLTNTILENISKEEWINQEKRCKSDLLYVGYDLMIIQREELLRDLDTFEKDFSDLSKNQEYLENNAYKVNRIFMEIQELNAFVEIENFENAKASWKELMEFF